MLTDGLILRYISRLFLNHVNSCVEKFPSLIFEIIFSVGQLKTLSIFENSERQQIELSYMQDKIFF